MKNILLIGIILITFSACKKPIEFKYQEREQLINCNDLDAKLAHEAYYSFRNDLAEYTMNSMVEINYHNYPFSLALFVFKGAEGTAEFLEIASSHTLKILQLLKQEEDIWDLQSKKSNLNYNSEFIDCLILNIENEDVKHAIISFRDVNTQNPKSFAELYRTNIKDADEDHYFAMFLAFEIYYQYLYDIVPTE